MVEGVDGLVGLLHSLEGVRDVVVDRQLDKAKTTQNMKKKKARLSYQQATRKPVRRDSSKEGGRRVQNACCTMRQVLPDEVLLGPKQKHEDITFPSLFFRFFFGRRTRSSTKEAYCRITNSYTKKNEIPVAILQHDREGRRGGWADGERCQALLYSVSFSPSPRGSHPPGLAPVTGTSNRQMPFPSKSW